VNEEAKKRLGAKMVDEIGKIIQERKAKGRLEAEVFSIILACKRRGHSRNPDGKCVLCYDQAPEDSDGSV